MAIEKEKAMKEVAPTVIFIVGLGAPASIYTAYLENLRSHLPQMELHILEWWKQTDFGVAGLQSTMEGKEVIVIGHSAGSVLALQAFSKGPGQIKKIIMLDSHFLRTQSALPGISQMLDLMLNQDDAATQNKVRAAYAQVVENDSSFKAALQFAVDWVNAYFDQVCPQLKAMPQSSVLYIGFTNPTYQKLNAENEEALLASWKKWGVDVEFFPSNHFDLIEVEQAAAINQLIADWLNH
jgi:pimeloyl-ACP methyl ester carboxylesterase